MLKGSGPISADRFIRVHGTFPRYRSSNLICMKIQLMFYLFRPSGTCGDPLGFLILYGENKSGEKERVGGGGCLCPRGRRFNKFSEMEFCAASVGPSVLKRPAGRLIHHRARTGLNPQPSQMFKSTTPTS